MDAGNNTFISPRLDLNVGEVVNNVPNESGNLNVSVEELRAGLNAERRVETTPLVAVDGSPPVDPSQPELSGYSIPSEGKAIDIVFMFVHGASFSSKLFDSNLKEFLGSLSDVNHDWFWELDLNFHVEMIDWKSCLAPYQFKSISRCMPVESIYETEDDFTENASSSEAAAAATRLAGEDDESGVSEVSFSPTLNGDAQHPTHVRTESMLRGLSKYFRWKSAGEESMAKVTMELQDNDNDKSEGDRSVEPVTEVDTKPVRRRQPSLGGRRSSAATGRSTCRRGSHASHIPLEPSNVQEFYELQKKHGLRVYFSNTVVDVMFYLTARYGGFMVTQVGRMLNQRVQDLRDSPCGRFKNSEIVLIGHSLGSVILYELLAQRPLRATEYDDIDNDETSLFADQSLPSKDDAGGAVINFDVKHLFLWGSPLSSFLVLKNDKSLKPDGALTQMRGKDFRMYNIFHRSDPIATRIEPIFYRDRDYIPPAVRIPSYHHGDVLRRGLELVTKNSVRAAASMFVSKLFSNGSGTPYGTEDWVKKLLAQRRYTLPDNLNRFKRFGVLTFECDALKGRKRMSMNRNPEALTEGLSELQQRTEGSSERQQRTEGLSERQQMTDRMERLKASIEDGELIGGDRLNQEGQDLEESEYFLRQRSDGVETGGGHKPWTIRQLALNCSRKLRKKASAKILEKLELIQADKRRGILIKLFSAIDAEFDSLLHSICSVGLSKVDSLKYEEEEWIDERKLIECLRRWQGAALNRELLLTSNQLRQEIIKSLTCRGSEIEREGQSHYPLRLDFCLAGGIQEMLIAPLGLLQSHLKYWGDRDTCLFMLKMITGFSPHIARSRREIIVSEAQRTKERVMRIIQRITR